MTQPARRMASRPIAVLPVLLVLLCPLSLPAQEEPEITVRAGSLPGDLPDWLQPLLGPDGVEVTSGGAAVAQFWFRTELPAQAPTGELGIEYGTLPRGALVGLVRLEAAWSDYKKQPIAPGLFTLRYGIQPADGDHTGQTWFRDFLMLLPVAEDQLDKDGAEQDPLVEASKKVSTTTHPAVIALFQIYDPLEGPGLVWNDLGQPMLGVVLGDLVLGLVLEGHGEEATL